LEGNHPRTIWGKIGPIPSIGSDEDFKRFLNQSEAITAILDGKKTFTGHNFGRGTSKEYHIQDCPGSYGEEVQNQNVKVDGRLMTGDGKTSLESLDLMS
jgi:hypothetical protein